MEPTPLAVFTLIALAMLLAIGAGWVVTLTDIERGIILRKIGRPFGLWRTRTLVLRCQLTQAGAATLDVAALCGLGHNREALLHEWLVYSVATDDDYDIVPAIHELGGEARINPAALLQAPQIRLLCATPRQEHLVDRHGYVPGIYQLDPQHESTVLNVLNTPGNLHALPPPAERDERVEHAEHSAQHRDHQRHPLLPVHAASPCA